MKKIKAFLTFVMIGVLAALAGCAQEPTAAEPLTGFAGFMSKWGIWILLGVIIIGWFFLSGSRRKKQVQEGQNMLNSIRPGVYVMTQGGVIGKVVEVNVISPTEKHVVLETGNEEHKSYITYDIRAIGMIIKPEQLVPRPVAEELLMPSDEEIQKRLDEVYSVPATVSAAVEEVATPEATVAEVAVPETVVETAAAEKPKTKAAAKKPAAKKPKD